MWKLKLYKGDFKHEHFALCIEYLKEFLTKARRDGYDGFIFKA